MAKVEVRGAGHGLHWEALDADFTVPGLIMGLFGTRAWMAREQARHAGAAKSPAKAIAELPGIDLSVKGVESTLLRMTRLVRSRVNCEQRKRKASG